MSQATPHTYRNRRGTFKVAFDELEPEDTITMRQATFEKLANVKITDATVAVRGEPGAIPRSGRAVAAPEPVAPAVEHLDHGAAQGNAITFDREANASLEEKQAE